METIKVTERAAVKVNSLRNLEELAALKSAFCDLYALTCSGISSAALDAHDLGAIELINDLLELVNELAKTDE